MLKLIAVLSLAGGICGGADFGGRWAGTILEKDAAIPVYLTLSQLGEHISGVATFAGSQNKVPVQQAEVRGDVLTLSVQNDRGELLSFKLTLAVAGNPVFADRQVLIEGDAVSGNRRFDVVLYPTREPLGYPEGGFSSSPTLVRKAPVPVADLQGEVRLYVQVEPTGMVSPDHIRVMPGSEHALGQKAIECVKQWRFKPAFRNGYAIASPAEIVVNFRRI